MLTPEPVVLMNEDGGVVGTAAKSEVHGTDTPLHLAFSCYLLNTAGEVLVTRRALAKKTWPGVWTNTFCGHPAPGESLETAVRRRAEQELAASITSLRSALPNFRYRAVDAGGVVENEICPVFLARLDGDFDPDPAEVAEWAWAAPTDLAESAVRTPFVFSPWMREQLPPMLALGAFAQEQS
ncbi:MAG: isopentenyl-diphosphate Delta-isomerase [Microbacteriaceae bacterium]